MSQIFYNDHVMQEDAELFAQSRLPWDKLQQVSLLVTGATGLIGSTLIKALLYCNSIGQTSVTVTGLIRSREKAEAIFREVIHRSDLRLIAQDITQPLCLAGPVDYILHGASVTSSRQFVEQPVDTILTAIGGTKNMLELGVEKGVKGFVYLSSMEAYGLPDTARAEITEKDYGYIDPLETRSSYPEGKRMAECLCKAYHAQKGVPVVIARLVQTFGPGVGANDNRVFAQFARSVIACGDITLHTAGETKRQYLYTRDAIRAITLLLLGGEAGQAYNIANKETYVSIYTLAQIAAGLDETGKTGLKWVAADLSGLGYAPKLEMRLSTQKLEALGWQAEVGLREAFARMISSMKSGV